RRDHAHAELPRRARRARGGRLRDLGVHVHADRAVAAAARDSSLLAVRDRARRGARLPTPQLLSRSDLHGRLGRAVAWLRPRGHSARGPAQDRVDRDALFPLLVLAVPIADTTFVVARRLKHGEKVFQADQTHLHFRFLRRGYSQPRTVAYIWAWCGTLAVAAL